MHVFVMFMPPLNASYFFCPHFPQIVRDLSPVFKFLD